MANWNWSQERLRPHDVSTLNQGINSFTRGLGDAVADYGFRRNMNTLYGQQPQTVQSQQYVVEEPMTAEKKGLEEFKKSRAENRNETSWVDGLKNSFFGNIPSKEIALGATAAAGALTTPLALAAPQLPISIVNGLASAFMGKSKDGSRPLREPQNNKGRTEAHHVVDYYSRLRSKESSGDDRAKASTSSATGRYQFTDGTWNNLMRSRPDLGLTANGRFDPAQQERAIRAFTQDNARVLTQNGVEANDKNLYMAHFLGAGDAPAFIKATMQNPNIPAINLVSPQVANANKTIFFDKSGRPKTAGEVYGSLTNKFGGNGISNLSQSPQQQAGIAAGYTPNYTPATQEQKMAALNIMRSTAPGAEGVRQQVQRDFLGQAPTPQYNFVNTPQGLMRTNQFGEAQLVQGTSPAPKPEAVNSPLELLKDKSGRPLGFYDKREGRLLSPEEARSRGIEPQSKEQINDIENFGNEHKLRTELNGITKDFREIDAAYNRIQSSAKDPSAMGDLALIFNYMKMLDPGSVVRESEFANAENAAGVPERVRVQYNKLLEGQRLTTGMRADMLGKAGALHKGQMDRYNTTVERYRGYAKQYGFNPDNIGSLREDYANARPDSMQSTSPQKQSQQPQFSGSYAASNRDYHYGGSPQSTHTYGEGLPSESILRGPAIQVKTIDDIQKLPPNTVFITPDGRRKVKL